MTHTPGPWHGNGTNSDDPDTYAIYSANSRFICSVKWPFREGDSEQPSDEEREANARLIKEAPFMLETLKQIVRIHDHEAYDEQARDAMAQWARDAIARVTKKDTE